MWSRNEKVCSSDSEIEYRMWRLKFCNVAVQSSHWPVHKTELVL